MVGVNIPKSEAWQVGTPPVSWKLYITVNGELPTLYIGVARGGAGGAGAPPRATGKNFF